MQELMDSSIDVSRHGKVNYSLFVVPIQCYAYVEFTGPISSDDVLLFDTIDQMECVPFICVLYTEIIYDEGKSGVTSIVCV